MVQRKVRKDKANRELDIMIKNISNVKDSNTMSLSSCLNRIMVKINFESYNDNVVEELRNDFDYVKNKLGTCPEESAILACVLENNSGYHSCEDKDVASHLGLTNIEFLGYHKYLDSLSEKRIIRISKDGMGFSYKVMKEACKAAIMPHTSTHHQHYANDIALCYHHNAYPTNPPFFIPTNILEAISKLFLQMPQAMVYPNK